MAMRIFSHILIIVSIIGAYSMSTAQEGPRPITKSGSAAWLFSIGGPGTFGIGGPSANGTADPRALAHTGFKYFLDDNLALRAIASLDIFNNGNTDAEEKWTEFGVGVGVEHHLTPLYAISPYIGGGIGYWTETSTSSYTGGITIGSQHPQSNDHETTTSNFGITVLAGFDWYPWKGIAIGAEYSLGFTSGSSKHKNPDGTEHDGGSPSSFGISPGGGSNIHLTVYF
jgi:hypothetical protein